MFSSVYLSEQQQRLLNLHLILWTCGDLPKQQITRNMDSKMRMDCSLILRNAKESTSLNMRHSSADLPIKFKRYSKAARVVLCHGAVYCSRLPSSSSNTVHDWG